MDSGEARRAHTSAISIEYAWLDESHGCPFAGGIAGSAKVELRNAFLILLSHKYTDSNLPDTVQLLFHPNMDLGPHLHIFLLEKNHLTGANK